MANSNKCCNVMPIVLFSDCKSEFLQIYSFKDKCKQTPFIYRPLKF